MKVHIVRHQADEKAGGRKVAGLPHQFSHDFNARWRHKAAATSFFISLPGFRTTGRAGRVPSADQSVQEEWIKT